MEYTAKQYGAQRFGAQYPAIYQFFSAVADTGFNEHFHWGRMEWMLQHTMLDTKALDKIVLFQDETGAAAGLVTYDTVYDDRTYLLHANNDPTLLQRMIDYAIAHYSDGKTSVIKVNTKDSALQKALSARGFTKGNKSGNILTLDLQQALPYQISTEFSITPPDFVRDDWKYQLMLHRGFDHTGVPEKWDSEFSKPSPNMNPALQVFALQAEEYCAHCGIWYTTGDTAYIEPVVTIPAYRKQGLAKAVVYEACRRAKALGAKRALVLSDQEFYYRIGFMDSSAFYDWEQV